MDRDKNDKSGNSAMAGGVSGAITRFFCQPFDVIKIRLQLQVEPIHEHHTTSKYKSLYQTVRLVYQEEGVLAFWKGHNPAQLLSITYGVAQFSFYEHFNSLLRTTDFFENHGRTRNFCCGAVSGSFAALTIMPLDVVRTRLISQDPGRGYNNAMQGIRKIYIEEGIRGMYRGLGPALWQIAPMTGGQFMFYNIFGEFFKHLHQNKLEELHAYELFICGGLAGFSTKLIVYPLDLAKKRMQIQGFSKNRRTYGEHFVCDNMISCLRKTAILEGFTGLYKGLSPALLKAAFTSAFYFAIYDEIVLLWK